MSSASQIFDRLLLLPPGQRITINFDTEAQMKSKKVILYREKKKYEDSQKGLIRKSIFIGQEQNKKKKIFKLHLSTEAESMDWLKNAVIVDNESGEVLPLNVSDVVEQETEAQRIKRLQELEKEE